jgi:hypothetical protein
VKDVVALLLAAFGLIATTRWLLVRCYSPPQPARLARLALTVHTAGWQQRTAAVRVPLNATTHLPTPVGVWHALAPSGRCPAPIPTWDWQLLLAAARAERSHELYEAMERLRASSSLAYGELVQLVHSYRAKLRDPEFAHILDPSHARCGGRCSSMVRVPPWWCRSSSTLACWGWLSGGLAAIRTRDEPRSRSGPSGRRQYCRAARPKSPILRASTAQPLREPRLKTHAAARVRGGRARELRPRRGAPAARVERASARGSRDGARLLRRRAQYARAAGAAPSLPSGPNPSGPGFSLSPNPGQVRLYPDPDPGPDPGPGPKQVRLDDVAERARRNAQQKATERPGGGGGSTGGAGSGGGGGAGAERLPSVLVLMIDATSRAHFQRSLPLTLAALREIGQIGGPAPRNASGGGGWEAGRAGGQGRLHVFDFEQYNIVGFNSVPNQMPLFCGIEHTQLPYLQGSQCVWEVAKAHGAVTMMADEVHDGCQSPTCPIHAIQQGAFGVASYELPDHRWWRALCSPHVPPCCWVKGGFLNPGRRQCVGGGRHLHEVELGYVEEWLEVYADAPRRWASVNTMVAHLPPHASHCMPPTAWLYSLRSTLASCALVYRDVALPHILCVPAMGTLTRWRTSTLCYDCPLLTSTSPRCCGGWRAVRYRILSSSCSPTTAPTGSGAHRE